MNNSNESMFQNRSANIALVIIGNEVLSGDSVDTNGSYLAKRLSEIGHKLKLIITIPDAYDAFEEYVKPLVPKFDLIFTSGGIGPTPDDITREAIAQIFCRELVFSEEALEVLREFYGDRLNDNTKRMAIVPKGATLVHNSRTGAPGFIIENVYCFAGVPQIFSEMFEVVAPCLGGKPMHRCDFTTNVGESRFSDLMRAACLKYPNVEIGSYPRLFGDYRVKLVFKGDDATEVEDCCEYLRKRICQIEQ